VALQLRKYGIRNVHPLLGGYYDWKELGYPLEQVVPDDDSDAALNVITSGGAA
jgi:3-mercaptopyruvate sulfurtransferase SseA